MNDIIDEILKKENITYSEILRAKSGFVNLVYFIDDNFVIKISKDDKTMEKLKKEISIYKNIKISNIPKFISSGNYKGVQYLIIEKLKGDTLYSVWHSLASEERHNCIIQIARILREFNSQDINILSKEYQDLDWSDKLSNQLRTKSRILSKMGYNTEVIDSFILYKLPKLFEKNIFGLVYNDAHFDNFIYNNGKISVIDFDRVRVCPIDYEMMIFKTMCDNPLKFASEENESKIKAIDYINIYEQFKKEYPQMFYCDDIEMRIKVYQFNYLIGQAIDCREDTKIKLLIDSFKV